jgi:hypothetical protein
VADEDGVTAGVNCDIAVDGGGGASISLEFDRLVHWF